MERIIHERYFICKNTNTSYIDVGVISPLEREYILGYIQEELELQEKAIKEAQGKLPSTSKGLNSNG